MELTHSYAMGDNESKSQARVNCLNEIKRKAAEQAGAYVEVISRSENFQFSSDEILSFAAAVLKIEILGENMHLVGDAISLTVTARALIDTDEVKQRLALLDAERKTERALAAQNRSQTASLPPAPPPSSDTAPLAQLSDLSAQQSSSPDSMRNDALATSAAEASAPSAPAETASVPAQGTTAPPSQASSSEAIAVTQDPVLESLRLERKRTEARRKASHLLSKGMSVAEVEHLAGEPFLIDRSGLYTGYEYGGVWVVFRQSQLACVRKRLEYKQKYGSPLHCSGLAENFVLR